MRHYLLTVILVLLAVLSCKPQAYYTLEVSCNPSEGGTVSPSSESFLEGETISIKATASAEYLFEGWSGDAKGSSNPISLVMDSDKNIVANFVKKSYSLTIEVEGCGHVEEKLIGTKTDYESGSIVELTAVPDEYWKFDHWEGDIVGADNPMKTDVTSANKVKAVFYIQPVDLPDLSLPSYYLNRINLGLDQSQFGYSTYQKLSVDYDRDGVMDVITAHYKGDGSLTDRIPIGFYKGKRDGTYEADSQNDRKIEGMHHIRKMIYGDYNHDGFPDICLLGHGYDGEPWPGEYPVILMSGYDGVYSDVRLTELVSYYHGGASGDFDNDGDLDIFLCDNFGKPGILVNDGDGNFEFHQELVNSPLFVSIFNAEMVDIDGDGYLDIICGGHDWEDRSFYEKGDISYSNTPIVFWGDGISFNNDNYIRLPACPVDGYGLTCDFHLSDLDGDGVDEIIIARTGDGVHTDVSFYAGWHIQILKRTQRSFSDATSYFLKLSDSFFKFYTYTGWIVKIDIVEENGTKFLVGAFDCPEFPVPEKLFQIESDGSFKRVFNY